MTLSHHFAKLGVATLLLCQCTTTSDEAPIASTAAPSSPEPAPTEPASTIAPHSAAPSTTPSATPGTTPSTAFKAFPTEFTALQKVTGAGKLKGRNIFVQLRKQGEILTVVALEPFLKTPLAQAKVTKTTETVRWLIPQPKGTEKVGKMLRYLYQFYYSAEFKPHKQGQWRFAKGQKLPIFEFRPALIGPCWSPGTINVFDGKKGTFQARVKTERMSC